MSVGCFRWNGLDALKKIDPEVAAKVWASNREFHES